MSYEYEFKEYIRDEILSNINHMNILDYALEELDHVYSQAAKADECEVKAEAFEDIYAHFNQLIHGEIEQREFESYAFDIAESFSLSKYGSGGSDE